MNDYEEKKRDAEMLIRDLIKKVSPKSKQRVADILTGVALAERPSEEESPYPSRLPARCG